MYNLVYDNKFDILYIREEGKGNFDYYGDEDENGVVKFLDQDTNELKGFMIYGFANRLGLVINKKSNDDFKYLADNNIPTDVYEYAMDIHKFGYCPNCNGDVDNSMNFCKHCGAELNWNIKEPIDNHKETKTAKVVIQCVPNCVDCEHYRLCDYNRNNPTVLPFS